MLPLNLPPRAILQTMNMTTGNLRPITWAVSFLLLAIQPGPRSCDLVYRLISPLRLININHQAFGTGRVVQFRIIA
jgi:hypothetical protein